MAPLRPEAPHVCLLIKNLLLGLGSNPCTPVHSQRHASGPQSTGKALQRAYSEAGPTNSEALGFRE